MLSIQVVLFQNPSFNKATDVCYKVSKSRILDVLRSPLLAGLNKSISLREKTIRVKLDLNPADFNETSKLAFVNTAVT